ncbi:MAG: RDD family protein [Aeromicrobium sp.]
MNEPDLSIIPLEARSHQGTAAGVVTRLAASSIDGLVVGAVLIGSYAGYAAFLFVVDPRRFEFPDLALVLDVTVYLTVLLLYLTAAWSIGGRTFGDHVMGVRVVTLARGPLRPARALARAALCAVFPMGLLWCAVNPRRRSVQDLLLRTMVVYDWLPRRSGSGQRS